MNDQEIKDASLDELRMKFAQLNSLIITFSASSKEEDEAIAVWDEIQRREQAAGIKKGK